MVEPSRQDDPLRRGADRPMGREAAGVTGDAPPAGRRGGVPRVAADGDEHSDGHRRGYAKGQTKMERFNRQARGGTGVRGISGCPVRRGLRRSEPLMVSLGPTRSSWSLWRGVKISTIGARRSPSQVGTPPGVRVMSMDTGSVRPPRSPACLYPVGWDRGNASGRGGSPRSDPGAGEGIRSVRL